MIKDLFSLTIQILCMVRLGTNYKNVEMGLTLHVETKHNKTDKTQISQSTDLRVLAPNEIEFERTPTMPKYVSTDC